MDYKLARGTTRRLLRSIARFGDLEKGSLAGPLKALMDDYLNGGVQTSQVVTRGFQLQRQLEEAGPCSVEHEVVKHLTRKRILIEYARPGFITGSYQGWIACATTLFDLGRRDLLLVETTGHIAVSQHTLVRLFERGCFREIDLVHLIDTATLWACPLLQATTHTTIKAGTEVAIPFLDGLLLGVLKVNPMTLGQGPTAATISGTGSYCEYLTPAFGSIGQGVMVIAINTYVGAQELYENQRLLYLFLQEFVREFGPEMRNLRAGMRKGLPDILMAKHFDKTLRFVADEDVILLRHTLKEFFSTPEWKFHAGAHRRSTSMQL